MVLTLALPLTFQTLFGIPQSTRTFYLLSLPPVSGAAISAKRYTKLR